MIGCHDDDKWTGTVVALRSSKSGKYVHPDDDSDYLSTASTSITDSDRFYLINVDGGVALKNVRWGLYVCNPKLYVFSTSDEVKCVPGWDNYHKDGLNPAGLFKMECDANGGWSFLARNGKYLCVADGGWIKTVPKETFRLELLDEPTLQDQIDKAQSGDTINLKEGIYTGTVTIESR